MQSTIRMPTKRPIVLQGVRLAVHIPTEARLKAKPITGLEPHKFEELGFRMEDYHEIIDEKYKNQQLRGGAAWEASGTRIMSFTEGTQIVSTVPERLRRFTYSPFPKSFENELKSIRRKIYDKQYGILRKLCVVLEGGTARRNIYIMPYGNIPDFCMAIDEQNIRITELNEKISEFMDSEDYKTCQNILIELGVYGRSPEADERIRRSYYLEHISYTATPLALDPTLVRNMVDRDMQRFYESMDEEKRRSYERFEEEMAREQKRIYSQTIKAFRDELAPIARRMAASKFDPEQVRKDLENLHRKSVSLGLEALANTVVQPLGIIIDDPDKLEDIFGTKDLEGAISGRIQGLLDNL